MNSRQIEQIAVNAVKDIFLQSEIFNPCIPDNDREPIWDGFIPAGCDLSCGPADYLCACPFFIYSSGRATVVWV